MGKHVPLKIDVFHRPGQYMDDLSGLVTAIQDIAFSCFNEIPPYQAMLGTREALSDKLISLARDESGTPVGFCSMVFLPVADVGDVLHLGLTCVHPRARGLRLTHKLVKKAITGYLLRQNPLGKIWISNCASVLSSLGNVAMHFENVYPSPFFKKQPTRTHIRIAQAIDCRFRDKMYVMPDAVLDEKRFVFKGSVRDTVFQKQQGDLAYHHRKKYLNRFYTGLMAFDQGDEVLQIGYFRLASVLKYYLRQHRIKKMNRIENQAVEVF